MNKFLAKFLSEEQIATVLEAYKAKNPEATELPIFVSKKRLDEVITERDNYKKEVEKIPKDWQEQINALNQKVADGLVEVDKYKKEAENVKAEADIDGKLYKANAKNIVAVKALIDRTKSVDEEITRLQKDEAYLFGTTVQNPPPGPSGPNPTDPPAPSDSFDKDLRMAIGLS